MLAQGADSQKPTCTVLYLMEIPGRCMAFILLYTYKGESQNTNSSADVNFGLSTSSRFHFHSVIVEVARHSIPRKCLLDGMSYLLFSSRVEEEDASRNSPGSSGK